MVMVYPPTVHDLRIHRHLRRPARRNPDVSAIQAARDHGRNFGFLMAKGTLPPDSLDPDEYLREVMADLPFRARRSYIFTAFIQAIATRDDRQALWRAYWAALNEGLRDGIQQQI